MVAVTGLFWKLFGGDPKKIDVHPKLGKTIKWVFSAGGKNYYEFEHSYEIPTLRFRFAKKFYEEVSNRVTHEELKKICEQGKTLLNEGKLGETWRLLDDLNYQLDWAFEPESLLRFASVIYFDLDEPINDYDSKYNERKIRAFKKKEILALLVRRLMSGSQILSSLSIKDLDTYLSEMLEEKERMSFTEGGKKDKLSRNMKTTSTTSTRKETKEKK